MAYLSIIAGFLLLFAGGESLVRGAVGVARRYRVSRLLIGLTVVATATSLPELLVSLRAAVAGSSDLAIGNVVGSNIANVALILGVAGVVRAIVVDRIEIRRDGLVMLASMVALWAISLTGQIGRLAGLALLSGLAVYIVLTYRAESAAGTAAMDWHTDQEAEYEPAPGFVSSLGLVSVGVVALLLGADFLVRGASSAAESFGVPLSVVGLTVVALGTSLPELAISVVAVARKHHDVAVGNVIGSNIFNTLLILGVTSSIKPIGISRQVSHVDIPVMLLFSAAGIGSLLIRGRIGRVGAAGLLAAYAAFVVLLFEVAM